MPQKFTSINFFVACRIVEIFSAICEHCFDLRDEIGNIGELEEQLLVTLVEVGPKLICEPNNESYLAKITRIERIIFSKKEYVERESAVAIIGNELSSLYNIPYAVAFSVVVPSWAGYISSKITVQMVEFARKVFGIKPSYSEEETIEYGIMALEHFFTSLNMPISFYDYDIPMNENEKILQRISFREKDKAIGSSIVLSREDVACILDIASGG